LLRISCIISIRVFGVPFFAAVHPQIERMDRIMAICQKCGIQVVEGTAFCPNCGAPLAQPQQAPQYQQPPQYQPPQQQYQQAPQYQPPVAPPPYQPVAPVVDPSDHTADFDAEDISANKVVAMAAYLLGILGIVVALLAAPESKYASFHARQALKLEVVNTLLSIVTVVLVWTFIVPIVGGIAVAVLFVIRIILFFQVCSGKAKDAPLLSKIGFLN